MASVLRTLRTHWKKSTAGGALCVWGATWAHKRHKASLLRRAACEEALVFGNERLFLADAPKRITVFLNPAASNGKAKNLFDLNAAPILHLAGFEVTVVKTDHEGQAQDLLGVLDRTDAIVVAGGNGTLLEVVTGMLRRDDEADFSKIPIGIIPLGKVNTVGGIVNLQEEDQVRRITSAALAIVRGSTVPVDVLQVVGVEGKPVYALSELRWGNYRDAQASAPRYWYLGPLKKVASYLLSTFQEWPPSRHALLSYAEPAERPEYVEESPGPVPRASLWRRIYNRFLRLQESKVPEKPVEETPPTEMEISSMEVVISSLNTVLDLKKPDAVDIVLMPSAVTKMDFIRAGMQKENAVCEDSTKLQAKEVSLKPQVREGCMIRATTLLLKRDLIKSNSSRHPRQQRERLRRNGQPKPETTHFKDTLLACS
ncbi:acylglycerol kinase, mitochondrial-like isoform X1 [Lethenteron reissneri]|uniref:acylglycerol kinase, mitochondrial-like isoform X1 n=1 Tax=Lethenteron reissneri TaxID=7753 RepID=UPI002AB7E91F|nr:acylglycerol kinase, mitochondrial-like isoform X1 [Lethenteron reissneri]